MAQGSVPRPRLQSPDNPSDRVSVCDRKREAGAGSADMFAGLFASVQRTTPTSNGNGTVSGLPVQQIRLCPKLLRVA
jgi:hypothetical protein